jgi:hypothetical protein
VALTCVRCAPCGCKPPPTYSRFIEHRPGLLLPAVQARHRHDERHGVGYVFSRAKTRLGASPRPRDSEFTSTRGAVVFEIPKSPQASGSTSNAAELWERSSWPDAASVHAPLGADSTRNIVGIDFSLSTDTRTCLIARHHSAAASRWLVGDDPPSGCAATRGQRRCGFIWYDPKGTELVRVEGLRASRRCDRLFDADGRSGGARRPSWRRCNLGSDG